MEKVRVVAFDRASPRDLALIAHPDGGMLLPGGTIEPGESVREAGAREFREETGHRLCAARTVRSVDFVLPEGRAILLAPAPNATESILRRGHWVHIVSHAGDEAEVEEREVDLGHPDLPVVRTHRARVPLATLTRSVRRHVVVGHAERDETLTEVQTDGRTFGVRWLPRAQVDAALTPDQRQFATIGIGALSEPFPRWCARDDAADDAALADARNRVAALVADHSEPCELSRARSALGEVLSNREPTRAEGLELLRETLEEATSRGETRGMALSALRLGRGLRFAREHAAACVAFEQALALTATLPRREFEDFAQQHYAKCLAELLEFERAEALFLAALATREERGNPDLIASTKAALAELRLRRSARRAAYRDATSAADSVTRQAK